MREFWIDVRDYIGLYQVSNWGRVKSLERDVETQRGVWHYKEKILRQVPNGKGYLLVRLYKNGVGEKKLVHQLVADAFIENPNNYTIVHHKDHNQKNNRLENLEWISKDEHDAMHADERAELLSQTVYQHTLDGLLVNVWKSTREAARVLGFDHGDISKCCRGKYKKHKGYIWSFSPLA